MRVSDFMLNLAKELQEKRNITESTATQYLQTLFKLNGSKPFNNLAWTKKFDAVQSIISTYSKSTQANQYMVLSSALSLFSDKASYKGAHKHWRDLMMEAKKERDAEPLHEKSEKQAENWLTWDEVVAKKDALWNDIKDSVSGKTLTAPQYEKLIQYVVVSLYTDIAPRRNEYTDMYVVKKHNETMDKAKNYYDLTNQQFIFNKYKTQKTHGTQVVKVPEQLQQTLALYLKHHPLAKQKAKEYKLLVKQDGSNYNTANSITRILNKTFGKKVGSSMLRHFYLSSKYGDITKEMEEDAVEMGHTTDVQRGYIKE